MRSSPKSRALRRALSSTAPGSCFRTSDRASGAFLPRNRICQARTRSTLKITVAAHLNSKTALNQSLTPSSYDSRGNFRSQHFNHGERKRRNRRSVRLTIPSINLLPVPSSLLHLLTHPLPDTCPANAPPPTASLKPKTTPPCRSPWGKSMRAGAIRARTRCMRCVGL